MHRLWISGISALILLLSVSVAAAQFDRGRYDPHSVSALVDQVRTDLDRAYGGFRLSGDDRGRLNHAEKELREFAQKWEGHRFDKGQLDDAIGSIQHVLDNNKLPQHDRDAISDDVTELRRMREAYDRHEIG